MRLQLYNKTILSLILFLFFFLFQSSLAKAQTDSFKTETEEIFQSFKTKNYALIKPLLDDNARIGDLPRGLNDAIVPQIIDQLPVPNSYKITTVTSTDSGVWIKTTYTYKNGLQRPQAFLFDHNRKVINFDVLSETQTMTAQAPHPQADKLVQHFEADFEIKHGIILMKASLNNKKYTFIFDSGSPTLIFNSDIFDPASIQQSQAEAMGVGGTAQLGMAKIKDFKWQHIELKDFDGICMPLKQLQKPMRRKIAGLIGYTLFSDYQLTFDYEHNKIYFDLTDNSGTLVNPQKAVYQEKTSTILPFEQFQHIPVITVSIDGKDYKMGLDCGASQNLLMDKYYQALVADKNIKKRRSRKMRGAGSEETKVKTAVIKEITVNNLLYDNMPFAFEDESLEQLRQGYHMDIDGLLGYPFFEKHITVINYKAKEILIFN